ncbi:MAG: UDP-N-acetylmuramate dehydrogenase [Terriglobales bacterium]
MNIRENVPLATMTTLQVGGPAQFFAEARHEEDIREAVDFSKTRNLPLFVLGGGSNLLIADSGWPGLVLRISIGGLTSESSGNNVLFSVGAGCEWDTFAAQAVAQNCSGVECLSGIPGSVGGTPVQNVGAYGQEVAETIESVRAFDTKENRIVVLPRPACGFRYRASIFNTELRGRYIIVRVNYRLRRGAVPALKYADLQKHFAESKTPPSIGSVREAVREIRKAKGMLLVPGDADSRSAGSFFKNPILTAEQFQNLTARAAGKNLEIPSYPALDTHHKISAAWLVEHSGFSKGFRLGEAAISSKHALALVTAGNARAADVVHLKETIQQRVEAEWGIVLESEPVFVGF